MKITKSKSTYFFKLLALSILLISNKNLFSMEKAENKTHTPSTSAPSYASNATVKITIPQSYTPNVKTYKSLSIIDATKENNTDLALELIHKGVAINLTDTQGWTALHYATFHSNTILVEALLSNSANPNIKSEDGTTPLHLAANFNSVEIVQMLIKSLDINIDISNIMGKTPLEIAQEYGRHEIVEILESHKTQAQENVNEFSADGMPITTMDL